MANQLPKQVAILVGATVIGGMIGSTISEVCTTREQGQYLASVPTPLTVRMPNNEGVSLNFNPITHNYSVLQSNSVLPSIGRIAEAGATAIEVPTVNVQQNLTAQAVAASYNQQIDTRLNTISQGNQWIFATGMISGLVIGMIGGFGCPYVARRIREQRQGSIRLA
ncbi:MAG: hypothetical protein EYC62_03250 [Alphaproteobacteria bacterium]|nr:MAG: hypothetical protein EYC62_03250 [Alphaproteobacteria bacterium]